MRNHPDGRHARRNGALWAAEEDQVLRSARALATHRELAARLGRTSNAVAHRLTVLAYLDRISELEAAIREVAYEIERMESLSEVPQLGQIAWWRGTLRQALPATPEGSDA